MNEKKRNAITNDLIAAGWGVFFAHPSWAPNGIAIGCEHCDDVKGFAGDYYNENGCQGVFDDFGISLEINAIAAKHGCYTEWENPAVFSITEE